MPPKKSQKKKLKADDFKEDFDFVFKGPGLVGMGKEVWKGPMESFLGGVAAESLKDGLEAESYDKIFGIPPEILTYSGKKPEFADPNLGKGWAPLGKDKALEKLLQMVKTQTFMTVLHKLFSYDAGQKAWFLKGDGSSGPGMVNPVGISGELMASILQEIKTSPFWPDVTYYNDLSVSIQKALTQAQKQAVNKFFGKAEKPLVSSEWKWPDYPKIDHYHDEGPLYHGPKDTLSNADSKAYAAALAKDILSNPKGTRLNWESPAAQYALQKIIEGKILVKQLATELNVDSIKVKYYVRRRAWASGQKPPWKTRKKGAKYETGTLSQGQLIDVIKKTAESFTKTVEALKKLPNASMTIDSHGDAHYFDENGNIIEGEDE